MSELPALLYDASLLAGAASVLYSSGVATVAAISVLARCPKRRRDARETLAILLRRRPAG